MDINAQLLLDNDFDFDEDVYKIYDWVELSRWVDDKYFVLVRNISNMNGRNWSVHIDNLSHDTVGSLDIQTVEHFNDFLKILDIKFRLTYEEKEDK